MSISLSGAATIDVEATLAEGGAGIANNAALNTAMTTAAAAGGGRVLFRPGRYYFRDTIYPPANVTLQGTSGVVFELEPQDVPTDRLLMQITAVAVNVEVNDIELHGDLDHAHVPMHSMGLQLVGASHFKLRRLLLTRFASLGMHLQMGDTHTRDGLVEHVSTNRNGNIDHNEWGCGGLAITSATDVEFVDFESSHNIGYALDIEPDNADQRARNLTFTRWKFEHNTGSAVHAVHRDDNPEQLNGITFRDGLSRNNSYLQTDATISGELKLRGRGFTVVNNDFWEINNFAVMLQSCPDAIVTDNRMHGSGTRESMGIYAYGCRDAQIERNTGTALTGPAIYQESNDVGLTVAHNSAFGCGAGDGSFWGAGMLFGSPSRSNIRFNTVRRGQIVVAQCTLTAGTVLVPQAHWAAAPGSVTFTPVLRFVAPTDDVHEVAFICTDSTAAPIAPGSLVAVLNGPPGWSAITNAGPGTYVPAKGLVLLGGADNDLSANDVTNAAATVDGGLIDNGVRTTKLAPNKSALGLGAHSRPYEQDAIVLIDADVGIVSDLAGNITSAVAAMGNVTVQTHNAVTLNMADFAGKRSIALTGALSYMLAAQANPSFAVLSGQSAEYMLGISFRIPGALPGAGSVLWAISDGANHRPGYAVISPAGELRFYRYNGAAVPEDLTIGLAANASYTLVFGVANGKLHTVTANGASAGVIDTTTPLGLNNYSLQLNTIDGSSGHPSLLIRRVILRRPTIGVGCLAEMLELRRQMALLA